MNKDLQWFVVVLIAMFLPSTILYFYVDNIHWLQALSVGTFFFAPPIAMIIGFVWSYFIKDDE